MDERNEISVTVLGERIVIELSRPAERIGLSLDGWEQLRQACNDVAAAIKAKSPESPRN